jgi:hypothetical protein
MNENLLDCGTCILQGTIGCKNCHSGDVIVTIKEEKESE